MAHTAKAVANYFIERAIAEGKPITPMKAQKLVFFAHGWNLAIRDEDLIDEPIEAWKYGPVVRSLYGCLAEFGNQPITKPIEEFRVNTKAEGGWSFARYSPSVTDEPDPDLQTTRDLLDKVWEIYGKYTAVQLSNLSHAPGSPWDQVNTEHGGSLPNRAKIDPAIIKDFFVKQSEKNKK
ncbi:MAG TPA: type II toxin-antitoxin system antitoxin SocA domain-containing protein [Tepidisphaeraceae bacterium]|jgi:uncharacterized phage-associated protein